MDAHIDFTNLPSSESSLAATMPGPRNGTEPDERVREAVAYIYEHLSRPLTVNDVIAHIDVSRRWLEYAFRDFFGETPYQHMRRIRLEYARRILRNEPQQKIYEVARRTGFSSGKQLTMAFRHDFGLSPRQYRRSLQRADSQLAEASEI